MRYRHATFDSAASGEGEVAWTHPVRSIFLPVAGFGSGTSLNRAGSTGTYWLSVPHSDSNNARRLGVSSGNRYTDAYNRYRGQTVRPVRGFAE